MLSRTAAVLILIDFQGKLAQSMCNKEQLFANAIKLIRGFRALGLPILVTEQTPEKLGTTIPEVALELGDANPLPRKRSAAGPIPFSTINWNPSPVAMSS